MTSRRYPDKLTFQQRATTTAASGQVVEAWDTLFERWGKVEQTSAGESVTDNQLRERSAWKITIPFDRTAAAISPLACRVIWRDRLNVSHTLNISGVNSLNGGRMPELEFTAEV